MIFYSPALDQVFLVLHINYDLQSIQLLCGYSVWCVPMSVIVDYEFVGWL